MTNIVSNGSKWIGEPPDGLEKLYEVLDKYTLESRFEQGGKLIRVREGGQVEFFGNFLNLSHVFQIFTDEPDIVDRLSALIRKNIQTPDYLKQWEKGCLKPAGRRLFDELYKKCQTDSSLRRQGLDSCEDPFLELESTYSFFRATSIKALQGAITGKCYALRQGVAYHDLAFINCVEGGSEWWTLRWEKDHYVTLDTITFSRVQPENFVSYICAMENEGKPGK